MVGSKQFLRAGEQLAERARGNPFSLLGLSDA